MMSAIFASYSDGFFIITAQEKNMPWIWPASLLLALALGINIGVVLMALIAGRSPN